MLNLINYYDLNAHIVIAFVEIVPMHLMPFHANTFHEKNSNPFTKYQNLNLKKRLNIL
jgi:hypothetical protein